MVYVTDDIIGGVRSINRVKSTGRTKDAGLGLPTGAMIAGASVSVLVLIVGALAALHGATSSDSAKLPSIAIVSPQDRVHFQKQLDVRNFRPAKSFRLNPLLAEYTNPSPSSHYSIPPRSAVGKVNIPVLLQENREAARDALLAQASQLAKIAKEKLLVATSKSADATVDVASLDTSKTEKRFNLVMTSPEIEAPLPMARPEGWPKAPPHAPETGAKTEPPKHALSYASPNTSNEEIGLPPKTMAPKPQVGVAYYDISAHTIYLPDGTQLEAHSGNGRYRDNPQYVAMKNRGPTPPNTYKLSMRESLFHGVPALRLTPRDGINKYNRDGLLAHTYLRRRPGDSAGCIAIKDYYKFLKYYQRGEIHTLVIVPKLNGSVPKQHSTLASLFGG
jgi:hypothetical protein